MITARSSDIKLQTDRQTDTVASPRCRNRETNYRRYYRYHNAKKYTEADSSGRLLGNDFRRKIGSAKMRAIGRSDMLSLSRRRWRNKAAGGSTGNAEPGSSVSVHIHQLVKKAVAVTLLLLTPMLPLC